MRSTEIDRRTFLALAGVAALAPAQAARAAEEALFLGARLNAGKFEAAVIDERGRDRLVLPLEARGHSFAIDRANSRAVAFARSPGRFAVAFSLNGATEPVAIAAAPGRHFFGHGIFTPDGRLMIATENDYEAANGVMGVYDATNGFRRIGEFPTDGIGPHEVLLLNDGKTLCVANGGIQTHPDFERVKLNIAMMEPSLAYVDIASGEVVEKVKLVPELHQLSIRHMALDARGKVWFGCQYEGAAGDEPPLVGRHRRGSAIELFSGPTAILRAMRNYVGSVAVDASGSILGTSSPQGGVVVFWDTATGDCLGSRLLADGCGIAPSDAREMIVTSGRGAIVKADPAHMTTVLRENPAAPAWDNHLRRI
ncbi:DUF1513 domain-containing protein [Aquamicrobium sp. LC103]|uniref:DUF1513 domain-containing protein n=1 Tax=Aquamicrobium sp. LC103 TaxID=1120658 RepID=UPI00063EA905|nr:DUF1513 domain-containing protein [Aquamicrobium sp. LC103]TKT69345.1 DUF1513 domain-containing protein [Aquamicrobium sp. LC103]